MLDGTTLRAKFDDEWGQVRKMIATHPLTSTWIALAAGFVVGFIVG